MTSNADIAAGLRRLIHDCAGDVPDDRDTLEAAIAIVLATPEMGDLPYLDIPDQTIATEKMIAAAWQTWKARHGGKLGPGPAFREAIEAALALDPVRQEAGAEPDFVASIANVINEESIEGAACGWQPCTGCHETNEGYEVGTYPHSKLFGCNVGSGCSECGGLGVVWTYFSAESTAEMAQDIAPTPSVGMAEAVAAGSNWKDDPSADERWNAGLDYGQTQLCHVLGVDSASVNWDAATETLDGDVRAVIGNILTARFGDDWRAALAAAPLRPVEWREMSSAPKDGAHILARSSVQGQPPTAVHWHVDGWYLSVNYLAEYADHGCADLNGWMHLPAKGSAR